MINDFDGDEGVFKASIPLSLDKQGNPMIVTKDINGEKKNFSLFLLNMLKERR